MCLKRRYKFISTLRERRRKVLSIVVCSLMLFISSGLSVIAEEEVSDAENQQI